jgi:hypothetical protein
MDTADDVDAVERVFTDNAARDADALSAWCLRPTRSVVGSCLSLSPVHYPPSHLVFVPHRDIALMHTPTTPHDDANTRPPCPPPAGAAAAASSQPASRPAPRLRPRQRFCSDAVSLGSTSSSPSPLPLGNARMRSALRELLPPMSPSYAHPGVFLARTIRVGRRRAPARRSWRGELIADARVRTAQESARESRPTGFGVAMRRGRTAAPRTCACLVRRTGAGADAESAGRGRDDYTARAREESILRSAQAALVS